MKKLYIFLVLLSITNLSWSQLRMAILGGPHSASVKETNTVPLWETRVKPGYSSRPGIHLGVLTEIPLSSSSTNKWFLQPGILYMAKGRKFSMRNDTTTSIITDTISTRHNLSVNYIEVPLNLAYKIPLGKKSNFLLSAGPYLSFFYNGKQTFETRIYSSNSFKQDELNLESGNGEGKIKTFDAGFNVRAGFEIGSVLLTGFFSQGLTNFHDAAYDGKFRHQVRGVSIGFWLNKTKQPEKAPKDSDLDGIVDTADDCPDLSGPQITNGCPDRDNDGIADNKDKCPGIPGKLQYNGCPVPDSDGDGINDEADACPTKAGVPEFNGCPIPDMDGDGLNDLEDKCPTEAGSKENGGCPIILDTIKKIVEQKVNREAGNIFFLTSSDKLTPGSTQSLDEIAKLLQYHSSYKIVINGHTDSTGTDISNKDLSQKRAESVKNYLIQTGIEASRITANGYGSAQPLESNATAGGRAKNRRVEILLEK